MITWIDPAIDYFQLGVIDIEHIGPPWRGPDRLHKLWAGYWYQSFGGAYGGAIICASAADAQDLIAYAVQLTHVIEDICAVCRDGYNGPRHPRWNLTIPQDKTNLTPAIIENWWEEL